MKPTSETPGRFVAALLLAIVSVSGHAQAAPQLQTPTGDHARPEDAALDDTARDDSKLHDPKSSDPKLRELVTQLDADTLQARQQASDQLLAAGSRSIDPLVAALPHASAETTLRGLAILKKLVQSTDADTKRKAHAALEQLSRSNDSSLATQSATILKSQDPLARSATRGVPQMAGIPGGFRMFQVQMLNGPATRRIVARENNQTITIAESPEKGITVTVSERVQGKDQTTTVEANSVEELERKNAAAAALYRKYVGAGFGIPRGNRLLAPGMVIQPEQFRQFDRPRSLPPKRKP